jgi:hypothetical protein
MLEMLILINLYSASITVYAQRLLLILTVIAAAGCSDTNIQSSVENLNASSVAVWNQTALNVIRLRGLPPPANARALSMLNTGMFDAWAAYDSKAIPITVGAPNKQTIGAADSAQAKAAATSVAAYRVLVDIFPNQKSVLDATLAKQNIALTDALNSSPIGIGNTAATAVLTARRLDGSNQTNNYADTTGYSPVNTAGELNDINRWQPLTFCNGVTPSFLLPHWGTVQGFALPTGNALRPAQAPARLGEARFVKQSQDLIDISAKLTEEQKVSVEYWADGPNSVTPPGHWILFALATSKAYEYSLDQDVKLFMAVSNALFDASIASWDAKRAFDSVRPISAIRYLYKDQPIRAWQQNAGTQTMLGQAWSPYQPCSFITPPFAEYTSGHSAFSSAAAEILKRFTGSDQNSYSDVFKQKSGKSEANMPAADTVLSWPTFTAAANEAGMSRRYGGIHFEDGDLIGRQLGRNVAELVWNKSKSHFGD